MNLALPVEVFIGSVLVADLALILSQRGEHDIHSREFPSA